MSVTQSGKSFLLTWSLDTAQEVTIYRTSDDPDTELATLPSGITQYVDTVSDVQEDDEVTWTITGNVTMDSVDLDIVAVDPDDIDYTYGAVDPLASSIRYTTLADVKLALGITDTTHDTQLTSVIVASEIQIDQYLGRQFPDTGTNPEIEGIPEPIKQAATMVAMGVWKMRESPAGVAGSDGWLEPVDVAATVRREFTTNPLLTGYHAEFGMA